MKKLFIIILAILISTFIVIKALSNEILTNKNFTSEESESETLTNKNFPREESENETLIKHIGVDLNEAIFPSENLPFNRIFMEYGFEIPSEMSSNGPKTLHQPTFVMPLGTEVKSLVDGEIISIHELWSGDYGIHIAENTQSEIMFELEHVIDVNVKEGDKVRAGQTIAKVSDFEVRNYGGMGIVEIGVLKPGNEPQHLCPFLYLDKKFALKIQNELMSFLEEWEIFLGKDVYKVQNFEVPGCLTTEPIDG